jgi:hypothetical protein
MRKTRITVSEPWDFVVPNTNDNSFLAEVIKEDFPINSFRYTLIKVCQPFVYRGNIIEFLFLLKRHETEDGCYNALFGVWTADLVTVKDPLVLYFIIDMKFV